MLLNPKRPSTKSSERPIGDDAPDLLSTSNGDVASRLKQAYIDERVQLEHTDVELNRSRVVIMDQHGNIVKVPFLVEH
ncbi:hypothetical protein [Vibrio methylphosphonaticus]|uniref:hypothetical protein n=1 Tax=Vibrio methylphosphonaticus TaxID=2946866 RepID=UPI002029BB72|nr:hypothetical protein [Vibrio methylphosphonaticus]MCL9776663.1 hypothetical protein [Vibrio methylphosphonaticus]